MAFFDDVKDRINKTAGAVSTMTKVSIAVSKLNGEIRNAEDTIKKLQYEIGKELCEQKEITEDIRAMMDSVAEQNNRKAGLERRRLQIKSMNRCPNCGTIMREEARFCSACGTKMPEIELNAEEEKQVTFEIEYCPDCGAMRKSADRYCEICGHDYSEATETAAAEPVAAPVQDAVADDPEESDAQ